MKTSTIILIMLLLAIGVGGCASGVAYTDMVESIDPVSADMGRIYLYRTIVAGAAVQPTVYLNGEPIGKAQPKGFFYVDRPAGTYEISARTEAKRSLSLTLEPGEERFVRLELKMGVFVGQVKPVLVDNEVGRKEIVKTKYTGE